MTDEGKVYRIFLSAAEPSADVHCAGLIEALKKTGGKFEFVGVGGAEMERAGCRLLSQTANNAAMIYKAFAEVFRFIVLVFRVNYYLKRYGADLVIVCDSPAFNFHVAKAAKRAGIKTIFYVAPQLWAWAGWRIRKMKKCCDKLCCILPFEENWFNKRGVDTTFVGNPLIDEWDVDFDEHKKEYEGFHPCEVKIALLPGSRKSEINLLWRPMQQIALRLRQKYPSVVFTTVAVDGQKLEVLKTNQVIGFKSRYAIRAVSQTCREADFAIVASGSVTLQVAAMGCPMVIMYQSSKLLWNLVGRFLVKSKYLSLVNILAGRELVPEFMPYFDFIEPIVSNIEKLLDDRAELARTSGELIEMVKTLGHQKASEKVAQITLEMLQ